MQFKENHYRIKNVKVNWNVDSIDQVAGDWWVVRGVNCGQDDVWRGGYDWLASLLIFFKKLIIRSTEKMDIQKIFNNICHQFSLLKWTSFIGQFVHPVGDGVKGVDLGYHYFSQLQASNKIWCNIQEKINKLIKNIIKLK